MQTQTSSAAGTRPVAVGRDTPDMIWNGWGTPDRHRTLPAPVRRVVTSYLKVKDKDRTPSLEAADVTLVPSVFAHDDAAPVDLPAADAASAPVDAPGTPAAEVAPAPGPTTDLAAAWQAICAVVGPEHARLDDSERLAHAGGKSLIDLLTRRTERLQAAPDAVVAPADHDQVQALLEICSAHRLAVVPFGGGTSVTGGLDGDGRGYAGVVSLDLGRLTDLHDLDEVSRTATLGAGLSGPEAERLLRDRGWILGHYPQSFEHATIGGFAATRSSGQASAGYGRFDSMVEAVRMATPAGTLDVGRAPASAAGPDLRQLLLGSEGAFGVITAVTVRIHPVPADTLHEAWTFKDFDSGVQAFREVSQSGTTPTVMRLSDEMETRINLAMAGDVLKAVRRRCIAITTYDGAPKENKARRKSVAAIFEAHGGKSLGAAMAAEWEAGRYKAPYWRDPILDLGAIVETLETAAHWSRLTDVYRAVSDAVTQELSEAGARPIVMCHVSHEYASGASLYFTMACAAGEDPVGTWRRAKKAAGDAIVRAGGTITHHHAVGRDHLPWITAEIGELGVAVLRAVKGVLDPAGICNPGALLPADDEAPVPAADGEAPATDRPADDTAPGPDLPTGDAPVTDAPATGAAGDPSADADAPTSDPADTPTADVAGDGR